MLLLLFHTDGIMSVHLRNIVDHFLWVIVLQHMFGFSCADFSKYPMIYYLLLVKKLHSVNNVGSEVHCAVY